MDRSSDNLSPVELLAEDFLDRQQRGENPTIEEYCQRHPDLEDEIRDVFEGFLLIEDLKPGSSDVSQAATGDRQFDGKRLDRVGDYRIIREVGRGGMGIVYEAEQESLRRRVALKVLPKQHAADEKSLERFQREARAAARMHHTNIVPVFEVGHDDQWVFYAMQLIQGQGLDLVIDDLKRIRTELSLQKSQKGDRSNRSFSAKELPAHSIAGSLIVGRFQRDDLAGGSDATEASAAQSRQSQAAVSDSEALRAYAQTTLESSGSSVSAVLPGQSEISAAESNRHQYFHSVAEIGLQTARALSYAHARGIIHRDIKPSNLLLDAAGIVWVTDFGLAKTSDDAMTHTGDILGTIRYMSPERFRGQCDVRADLYSLGLTLYEMLVLKPAFSSPDRLRLIEMVTKAEPDLPRSLDPKIPRDLETIVLKCIDKDARRRYQSADELADDLQHFVDDEPIRARRISVFERLTRWSRRNKSLAASLAFAALLLLIINIVGPLLYWQKMRLVGELETNKLGLTTALDAAEKSRSKAGQEKEQADELRKVAIDAQQQLERELYVSDMQRVGVAYQDGNIAEMRDLLDKHISVDKSHDLRGWEWYYWWRASHLESKERWTSNLYDLVVAPDESWIAVRGWVNNIHILDGQSWETLHSFSSDTWIDYDARKLAVSADGKFLAALDGDTPNIAKDVKLWRTLDWSELEPLQADDDQTTLAFSTSGLLATGGAEGRVTLWNVEQRSVVGTPLETGQSLLTLTFSPDGSQLLTGGTASRFEAEGEAEIEKSPASLIAWDVESHAPTTIATAESGTAAVVSTDWASRGDGSVIAVGFSDGKVRLLDGVTFQELYKVNADGPVKSIALSSDGSRLAASTLVKNAIHVWETETSRQISNIRAHSRRIGDIAFAADGETILSAAGDSSLKSWNLAQSQSFIQWRLLDFPEGDIPNIAIALATDDQFLCRYHNSGQVQRWSTRSGEFQDELNLGTEGACGACSGNLGFMAIYNQQSSDDGILEVWKIEGAEPFRWQQATIPDQLAVDDIKNMTISNDGSVVAWSVGDEVCVLKVSTGDLMRVALDSGVSVSKLVLSPDGKLLALWTDSGFVNQIWNVSGEHAEGLASISGDGPIYDAKFSADGTRFAQALWNNEVRVMNPRTGEVTHSFSGHAGSAWALDFSPDGKRLASGGDDGIVRLWNLDPSSPGLALALSGHRESVRHVAFAPDGDAIGSVSVDGDVRVWKKAEELAHMGLSAELIARFAIQEEFDEVRPRLEAIVAEPWNKDSLSQLQLGVLHAYLGDREAHARYSRKWLQRSASTQDPFEADRCAKAYLILPEPHDRQLLEQAIILGRRSADLGKADHYTTWFAWFALCRGIAEFRAGASAEAIEWLSKSGEALPMHATALAFQAMAEFQLGHAEKASRLLQEAEALAEQTTLDADNWNNVLVYRMAVDEAKSMIEGQANQ